MNTGLFCVVVFVINFSFIVLCVNSDLEIQLKSATVRFIEMLFITRAAVLSKILFEKEFKEKMMYNQYFLFIDDNRLIDNVGKRKV